MKTIETEIEINGEDIAITVDFEVYPGDPGVWTYSNGDPGYPATGPEIDVLSIQDENGNTIPDELITSKWEEHITEQCYLSLD